MKRKRQKHRVEANRVTRASMGLEKYSDRDYEMAKKFADALEMYVNEVSKTIILVGISEKKEKKAIKKVKKLIKYLRDGQLDKVYDEDAYDEYMSLLDGDYY